MDGENKIFLYLWKNEHPDEEPNEELFTYPRPNPFTKGTAIPMMADAVKLRHAVCRNIRKKQSATWSTRLSIPRSLKVTFKECPITFKDIATIKAVFKEN